jgi:hypothetical protein
VDTPGGQQQTTEAERQAIQIRIRAEERCGELLTAQLRHGGDRRSESRSDDPTLKDLGISKQQSSDWQRLAAIPREHFEADLADAMWRPTTAAISSALPRSHMVFARITNARLTPSIWAA